jgi:RNA polymerase sigma-70 factor (ECF subfamily)
MDKTVELPLDLAEDSRDICRDMDVRRAFAELSDEERMILAMNIFGGYTSREIGKALHMSSNTVRSKQSRALKKMEACLER